MAYFIYFIFTNHIAEIPSDYRIPYVPPPSSYVVNDSFLLPVWNQHDRGTCWGFATVYMLESHYKHQGIKKGFLKDNEYTAFSEEGMMKWMVEKCSVKNPDKFCRSSYRRYNKTDGGSVEEFLNFYKNYDDFRKIVMPLESCPNQIKGEDQMICPDYSEKLKKTPIEFTLSGGELAVGIDKVKELIYKYKEPVTFSIGMPVSRYWYECDKNHIIANTSMCKDHIYPCKHNHSKYCSFLDYQISKPNTAEMITHTTQNIFYGVGHAMVLVGYNDNLVEPLPINISRKKQSKGVFILRNSWGARGHSLEYLSGKISHAQELQICPNPDDISIWTPVSQRCLKQNRGNGRKCSSDISRKLGGKYFTGGTELKCINETHNCVLGRSYYLLRNGNLKEPIIEYLDTGTPVATVIDSVTYQPLRIDTLPFEHLYYAFEVVNPPSNSAEHCGYLGYSYDTVAEIVQGVGLYTPQWRAIHFNVEFKDSSYARSNSKGKDYSDLIKSTSTHKIFHTGDPYEDLL